MQKSNVLGNCEADTITCEGFHQGFTSPAMDLYMPNSPPPDNKSNRDYVNNLEAEKGPLIKADRPYIEFRGKKF